LMELIQLRDREYAEEYDNAAHDEDRYAPRHGTRDTRRTVNSNASTLLCLGDASSARRANRIRIRWALCSTALVVAKGTVRRQTSIAITTEFSRPMTRNTANCVGLRSNESISM
jgi:hypothetical protein